MAYLSEGRYPPHLHILGPAGCHAPPPECQPASLAEGRSRRGRATRRSGGQADGGIPSDALHAGSHRALPADDASTEHESGAPYVAASARS